ncbi:MAG: 3'-5' exonuclease, partial [Sphingosinicella sp.]
DVSFRSSTPVLALVDRLLDRLGPDALGLPQPPHLHRVHPGHQSRPGSVVLWPAVGGDSGESEDEPAEEGWISQPQRIHAGQIAQRLAGWLERPFFLHCRGRALRPEDIMILLRRRGDFAAMLVARLHEKNVPVAGVDRLSLSAPLAVQDLLAAARFAAQPHDDLNLAELLVSPLFGWDQDQLHAVAAGRSGTLWEKLREGATGPQTMDGLRGLLDRADFATPHVFFETILSGPLDGRRKLLERLGFEARDPIETLLSAAIEFEAAGGTSLQAFLDWFARGEVEVKRDPSGPRDAVRVLTVHGAKGLQAPIVLLADACADPSRLGRGGTALDSWPLSPGGPSIPILRPRKDDMVEPLQAHFAVRDRRDREEHMRLLYVALTRAEERLYVGGSLAASDGEAAPPDSWYERAREALVSLGSNWQSLPDGSAELRFGAGEEQARKAEAAVARAAALPDWALQPAPIEERPPRPLAPSSLGEEQWPHPPPSPAEREAARRGQLLHALFERLPACEVSRRRELADLWLSRTALVADPGVRGRLIDDAMRIIADPVFAELFGPQSLAEAPIAAVLASGFVVTGAVDRLLIADERVLVADFKTGHIVPASIEAIPAAHLRQMAAYRAALQIVFPDRPVEAALLYTAQPVLFALPAELLEAHLPKVD